MIPIGKLREEDFYDDGIPKLKVITRRYEDYMNMYRHHLHNGEELARRVLGLPSNYETYTKTGHNLNPMLRSTWELLWDKEGDVLHNACSPFRTHDNINQDVCSYYQILSGKFKESKRRTEYKELGQLQSLIKSIEDSEAQLICINDNGSTDFELEKKRILDALEWRTPQKSKYET